MRLRKFIIPQILRDQIQLPLPRLAFSLYFGVYFFGISIIGSKDPNAPFVTSLHKDFVDGCFMFSVFNWRICQDVMGINNVPALKAIMDSLDCIQIDRRDSASRKDALNSTIKHFQEYKSMKGYNKLFMFAEGALSSKSTMRQFKPGPFTCLEGVQYLHIDQSVDWITGIDITNAIGYNVFFILWLARSYTVITVEFTEPLKQDFGVAPANNDLSFYNKDTEYLDHLINEDLVWFNQPAQSKAQDSMIKIIEENKDYLKIHGQRQCKQVENFVKVKSGCEMLENLVYFDGFDVKGFRDQLSHNKFKLIKRENEIIQSKNKIDDNDYKIICNEFFKIWVQNQRIDQFKKINVFENQNMQRTNEWILENTELD